MINDGFDYEAEFRLSRRAVYFLNPHILQCARCGAPGRGCSRKYHQPIATAMGSSTRVRRSFRKVTSVREKRKD